MKRNAPSWRIYFLTPSTPQCSIASQHLVPPALHHRGSRWCHHLPSRLFKIRLVTNPNSPQPPPIPSMSYRRRSIRGIHPWIDCHRLSLLPFHHPRPQLLGLRLIFMKTSLHPRLPGMFSIPTLKIPHSQCPAVSGPLSIPRGGRQRRPHRHPRIS